jgi:hypothetical protein
MTVEALAKAKTVNDFLKTLGTWALIGAVLWAVSEIRDTKNLVIGSNIEAAKMGERMAALKGQVDLHEGRLIRLEDKKN